MAMSDVTKELLAIKKKSGLSFADLEAKVGRDEVWIASVLYRQASASEEEAKAILAAIGAGDEYVDALTECPTKGSLEPVIPTDPFIYRFYEIMQVYGAPVKAVVHEQFGDGIMSAIDFSIDVEREEDPKGDRVKIIMCGKFLPYKKW